MVVSWLRRRKGTRGEWLTRYEDVFVWGTDELHGSLREQSHVLVDRVVGDVLVGAVEQRDQDVEQD